MEPVWFLARVWKSVLSLILPNPALGVQGPWWPGGWYCKKISLLFGLSSDLALLWLTLEGVWSRCITWQTSAAPVHFGGTSAYWWEQVLLTTKTFRFQQKDSTWVSTCVSVLTDWSGWVQVQWDEHCDWLAISARPLGRGWWHVFRGLAMPGQEVSQGMSGHVKEGDDTCFT